MKEYTDKDYIEIGKKVVEQRRAQADKDKENRKVFSQVMKLVKEGKIKLPKA